MNAAQEDATHAASPRKVSKRPRGRLLVACNHCRRVKTRCDHVRPVCGNCERTKLQCHYETDHVGESPSQALRRRHDNLQSLHQNFRDSLLWLSSQPSTNVSSYIQRLQHLDDPILGLCSIVATERGQDLPPRISPQDVVLQATPTLDSRLGLELTTCFTASYPLANEGAVMSREKIANLLNTSETNAGAVVGAQSMAETTEHSIRSYELPPRPPRAESLDEDLCRVDIDFWTKVPVTTDLASKLFLAYFNVEHPIYGFFDADLFTRDLISSKLNYCSPLLVNSILFWASCSFGPLYPDARALTPVFLQMAQSLLQAEQGMDDELTVAALMILSIGATCYGENSLGKKYMAMGIKMASRLHMIGEERYAAEQFSGLSAQKLGMLRNVAWGAFNLSAVITLHFHDLKSGGYTAFPPLLAKPAASIPLRRSRPDESAQTTPPFSSNSFEHFCQFWCIAHTVTSLYYSARGPIHDHVPLSFAEAKFHALLQWAESLPTELRRSDRMSHNVVEMHICYHAMIMDVFRPFLGQGLKLSSFAMEPCRPEEIFQLSLNHLKSLTGLYYGKFAGSAASCTISWVHGPLYVAPAILRYERHAGWKEDFLFCLKACSDLYLAHNVMEGFLRAVLGMAISANAISLRQAKAYLNEMQNRRSNNTTAAAPDVGFVIDQDLAMKDPAGAVGDVLVKKFEEMLFFEDVIEYE